MPLSSFLVENLAVEFSSLPFCLVGGNLGDSCALLSQAAGHHVLKTHSSSVRAFPQDTTGFLDEGLIRKLKEGETGMICLLFK